MKKKLRLPVRIIYYVLGFLIMTLGIAISVKSNLGVSPVSSIPYTLTCVWGIEMGIATVIFHVALVLIQILLLRKQFQIKNLLQIPAGILFGLFTSACNGLVGFFPDPTNIWIRAVMMLFSAFFIALGIFFYVPADIIPLAGEGTMLAISKVTKIKFSTVKICFDITMVVISLVTCLIAIHKMGSVGAGTIVAAVLVGSLLKLITRFGAGARDRLLYVDSETEAIVNPLLAVMKDDVYTINRETTLKEALTFFTDHRISGAPVVDDAGNLKGFISDGDIMRYLSKDHSLFVHPDDLATISFNDKLIGMMDRKVKDIARKNVITVEASMNIEEVCAVLAEHKLKKAPVMSEGRMVGMINVSNITKYVVELL